MQYISQLNFCAPLLPVNLTVNVRRFYNSVRVWMLLKMLSHSGDILQKHTNKAFATRNFEER